MPAPRVERRDKNPPLRTPKLFISYSHDSRDHQDRVRQLADRFRAEDIDAWIDQYAPAPSEGWPMWMQAQILEADFVLLVCTETYLRRVFADGQPSWIPLPLRGLTH